MRKILSLLIAVVLGVSTAFATTVYCKMTHSWWCADGAAIAVHYWGGDVETTWPGVRMTPVPGEEGTWSYDVPADVAGLIFVRVNGTGAIADWGAKTVDLTLPTDGKNLFTITNETESWGAPGCNGVWSVYGEEPAPQVDTVYTWYGKRTESASATEAIEAGGTAAAYGGNANIVVGTAQKTNWTIKLNKGFSNANYVGITLEKALAAGDKLQVAAFRTTTSDATFGIDFSADAASAATTCQVLFPNNLQTITTNVAPKDTIFTIPECAAGAKFIRIYRNSGSTGIYVANFTILREGGATPEPPVEPTLADGFYLIGQNGWNVAALSADLLFAANPETEGEYKLTTTLAEGQGIKVVKVVNDAIVAWYPNGTGNEYTVDAAHAGENKDIYFQETYKADWAAFGGHIWIGANEEPQPQGCDWDAIDFLGSTDPAYANQFKVCKPENVGVVNIQQPGFATEIGIYMTFPSAVFGTISLPESAYDIQGAGIIFHLSAFTDAYTEVTVNCDGNDLVFTVYNANGGTPVEPTLANGFYLIGQNGWDVAALSADLLFAANPEAEGEHVLNTTLAAGQEIKVVKVENDAIVTWYPDGMGNAYTVDQNHAGATTIYFRPAGNAEWAAFGGFMYVVPTGTTGIDAIDANAPAVKVLRNGQLLIKKGDKTYNVMGEIVR